MKEGERRFWHFMITTSVILNVVLIVVALTIWIWEPKAWLVSAWIAVCVIGGLWERRRQP